PSPYTPLSRSEKAHAANPPNPAQQAQRRLGFPFPGTNRFQVQQHVELGAVDLGEDIPMVIFDHGLFLALGTGFLDFPLAAARTTPTAAMEMLVGVHAQEEQAVDSTTFQGLVGFEAFVHLRQALAQVLQVKTLTRIVERVAADAFGPMDQMLPAPTLGLLRNIQVAAGTDDYSQQQAQQQGPGRNLRV